jgi:hypothetical protein
VTNKISILNYEIMNQSYKKEIVHVNRLKRAYNPRLWKPKIERSSVRKKPKKQKEQTSEDKENEIRLGPFPLVTTDFPTNVIEHQTPPNRIPQTTSPLQPSTDTPYPDYHDYTYSPPDTLKSRRDFRSTRNELPVTRARARILSQNKVKL